MHRLIKARRCGQEAEHGPCELVSQADPAPLGTQGERRPWTSDSVHSPGLELHCPALRGPSTPHSLSPLTNGVARGSHSSPGPIRRGVERLLNFGPDDPATASPTASHVTCPLMPWPPPAKPYRGGSPKLPSSLLPQLLSAPLPSLTAARQELALLLALQIQVQRIPGRRQSAFCPAVHRPDCCLTSGSKDQGRGASRPQHLSLFWEQGLPW